MYKELRFEWDENKNRINRKKHHVSFEEAYEAFLDEEGLLIPDPDHSDDEERFVLLGMTSKMAVLTVVHCLREEESVIRIISARAATKKERTVYLERRRNR